MRSISFPRNDINLTKNNSTITKKHFLETFLKNLGSKSEQDLKESCIKELIAISKIVDSRADAFSALAELKFSCAMEEEHISDLITLFTNTKTGFLGHQNITKTAAKYTKILMLILSTLKVVDPLKVSIQKKINLILNESDKWYRSDYLKDVNVQRNNELLIIQFGKLGDCINRNYELIINIIQDKSNNIIAGKDALSNRHNIIKDIIYVKCGTYALCDDINRIIPPVNEIAIKFKTRQIIKNKKVIVHKFNLMTEEGNEFELPGISTLNFFTDIYYPQEFELQKVKEMITELEKHNIYAFLSNTTHYALVIYAYGQSKIRITPAILAEQLDTNPFILSAILKAAKEGIDMHLWQEAFIYCFGSKQNTLNNENKINEIQKPVNPIKILPSDILMIKEKNGNTALGEPVLPSGRHKIQILSGGNNNSKDIITNFPICFYENKQFGEKMKKPTNCFAMHKDDFNNIKNIIHKGAFGDDFEYIENYLVVVWKIPIDLFYIDKFQIPQVQFEVGTYLLRDDICNIQYSEATKLRRDSKINDYEIVSVHTFKVGEKDYAYELPGISTGNFFKDFYKPQANEFQKVCDMIAGLKEHNIHAYLSNDTHHAIIIDKYYTERMTPAMFAEQLNNNSNIFNIISNAANKNMSLWKKTFINFFRSKSYSKEFPVDIFKIKNQAGEPVSGTILLNPGKHRVIQSHGEVKREEKSFETKYPICFYKNQKFFEMQTATDCLIIHKIDFNVIQDNIYSNDFGKDFFTAIGDDLVLIWKIPLYLSHIEDFIMPSDIIFTEEN